MKGVYLDYIEIYAKYQSLFCFKFSLLIGLGMVIIFGGVLYVGRFLSLQY